MRFPRTTMARGVNPTRSRAASVRDATRSAESSLSPLLCHLALAYLSPPYLVSYDARTKCVRA